MLLKHWYILTATIAPKAVSDTAAEVACLQATVPVAALLRVGAPTLCVADGMHAVHTTACLAYVSSSLHLALPGLMRMPTERQPGLMRMPTERQPGLMRMPTV
jgi:hypothetical protein